MLNASRRKTLYPFEETRKGFPSEVGGFQKNPLDRERSLSTILMK